MHTRCPGAACAALQQWLGGNLTQEGRGRYVWTFNVEGAESMFQGGLGCTCRGVPERLAFTAV